MRFTQTLTETLQSIWTAVAAAIPNILFAIVLLLLGWIIAKFVSKLIVKLFKRTKNSKALSFLNLDSISEKIGIEINLGTIVSKIVYWLIFLFFIVGAADTIGWTNVSKELSAFIKYIPKLLSALFIFILGYTLAKFIKNAVRNVTTAMGISMGKTLSEILFYFLLFVISLTALAQAEINTTIISSNMYIFIGAFAVAMAIALGLGAKDVVTDLLKNYYNKQALEQGVTIEINNTKGTIEKISKSFIIVKTEDEKIVYPAEVFYNNTYKILS